MRTTRALSILAALPLLLAAGAPAFAGGPLAVCESGQPYLWPAGGANIPFNPDRGSLGPLDNAAAVALTQDAFDVWGAVPSSTVNYVNAGTLSVDVDITNFEPFLDSAGPDGLSAIVFDDTGEIFDLLFGPASGVLGFAGPEWGDPATCQILEGLAFLNGPAFGDLTEAKDVMVHEFGHYTNLAHTVVNGQNLAFGDSTGPSPNNTFGNAPLTSIETMYPFYFGAGSGTASLQADDIAMVSTLYPSATFLASSGRISGRILAPNGTSKLTGVNVIARNVASPFLDAVSSISSDFSLDFSADDPFTGIYTLRGLTPGAQYVVYVDQILDGGFSTPPAIPLPGPEEFWNGASESNNVATHDDPNQSTPITVAAGVSRTGVDVILNTPGAGDPLPVGDDDSVELFLPFPFKLCGQEFQSVFVNANGSLTFGAGSAAFTPSIAGMLGGRPRIAGLWDDLNPSAGGSVSFQQSPSRFTVSYEDVPAFPDEGANTFSITLHKTSSQITLEYGSLTDLGGLVGVSCGSAVTTGFEPETDLRSHHSRRSLDMSGKTALFELFRAADSDLARSTLKFVNFKQALPDVFEPNRNLAHATRIVLPFETANECSTSTVSPVGGDVDFYRFRAKAGDILALEVVRGAFDSLIGVYDADSGALLATDDDGGNGALSRLLVQVDVNRNLVVAVSAFPDFGFTGAGESGGRYVLSARSYRGTLLAAGDDTSTEVPIPFPFRYQGSDRTKVFVNSNGNLTFGTGDTDFSESVAEFLGGPARIAPLWDDLDASGGLVIAESKRDSLTLHWVSVPRFFTSSPNYFSVELQACGNVHLDWGATSRTGALVGLSAGGGVADPGESDLSRLSTLRARRTTYELFAGTDDFDLSFQDKTAIP